MSAPQQADQPDAHAAQQKRAGCRHDPGIRIAQWRVVGAGAGIAVGPKLDIVQFQVGIESQPFPAADDLRDYGLVFDLQLAISSSRVPSAAARAQ